MWTGLIDHHINTPMGITAENLAEKHNISRQQCDEFAILTNERWKVGRFICSRQLKYINDVFFAASCFMYIFSELNYTK